MVLDQAAPCVHPSISTLRLSKALRHEWKRGGQRKLASLEIVKLGSKTFRFFNFWFDHPNFKSVVGIYLDLKTSLKLSNWTIFLPKSTGSGGDYNSRFFDSDMKARQTSFETWVGG
ncbi:hypothetical protein JHK87_011312 [Glycine soja]|nr:hypothetical protein JHK87_011312 [Glycine soja]